METKDYPTGTHRTSLIHSFAAGALLLIVLFLLFQRFRPARTTADRPLQSPAGSGNAISNVSSFSFEEVNGVPRAAEEIVARKVQQFSANRRKVTLAISNRYNEPIPDEILRFFDAVDAGNWPEIERLFESMAKRSGQYESSIPADPALNHFWPAVLETFGVVEQTHKIPADELLRFGESVLGSVRPGAVYVGGTDAGRFIPTLIAETSSGDPPIVLTQNALIDSRYLEYIQFLYGDRLKLPTQGDADRILAEFKSEALKRLEHDEQFPDGPRQVRHLESVKRDGEKVEVGGPAAVMDLNERLLELTLNKNPDRGFALQESSPLKGTYEQAVPAGPIMELRARSEPLSPDAAAAALDYWRNTAADIEASRGSDETLKNYSQMAGAQGNLLANQGHSAAAEQTYLISLQIYPGNIDTILNYRHFLIENDRGAEAATLLESFRTRHPELSNELKKWLPPQP